MSFVMEKDFEQHSIKLFHRLIMAFHFHLLSVTSIQVFYIRIFLLLLEHLRSLLLPQ